MIIIAGHELVAADTRDRDVAAFRDLVAAARQADGCEHVAITADSVDPERINTVEVWRDAAALSAWRKQVRPPRASTPRVSNVKQYTATDSRTLR